jgi:hypothetical protein
VSTRSTARWAAVGVYAAIGGAAVAPARVPALFGGTAATAAARTEVRTVYAGIPLAFTASLATCPALGPDGERAVLRTVGDVGAGMAVFPRHHRGARAR